MENISDSKKEANRLHSIFGNLSLLVLNEIKDVNDMWDETKFWDNVENELKKLK